MRHDRYASKCGHKTSCYLKVTSRNTETDTVEPTLTGTINSQLSQWRVVTALGEFMAVPHQELLAWVKWFDGVEVDVQTILAGN